MGSTIANKCLVVLPAYNEESYIEKTLEELSLVFPYILVVDDCSSDNTAKIARKYTSLVISHLFNLGQGGAIQTGINYFREVKKFNYLITFDADGQHRAIDALEMVKICEEKSYDLVVGSRFIRKNSQKLIPNTKNFHHLD